MLRKKIMNFNKLNVKTYLHWLHSSEHHPCYDRLQTQPEESYNNKTPDCYKYDKLRLIIMKS